MNVFQWARVFFVERVYFLVTRNTRSTAFFLKLDEQKIELHPHQKH